MLTKEETGDINLSEVNTPGGCPLSVYRGHHHIPAPQELVINF